MHLLYLLPGRSDEKPLVHVPDHPGKILIGTANVVVSSWRIAGQKDPSYQPPLLDQQTVLQYQPLSYPDRIHV